MIYALWKACFKFCTFLHGINVEALNMGRWAPGLLLVELQSPSSLVRAAIEYR